MEKIEKYRTRIDTASIEGVPEEYLMILNKNYITRGEPTWLQMNLFCGCKLSNDKKKLWASYVYMTLCGQAQRVLRARECSSSTTIAFGKRHLVIREYGNQRFGIKSVGTPSFATCPGDCSTMAQFLQKPCYQGSMKM